MLKTFKTETGNCIAIAIAEATKRFQLGETSKSCMFMTLLLVRTHMVLVAETQALRIWNRHDGLNHLQAVVGSTHTGWLWCKQTPDGRDREALCLWS